MPPARKRAVPACCEAAERLDPVASQAMASHRRRPLEVAIFIADGANKYHWMEHARTNTLVCESCSEVVRGLYRPLACLMAWAHRQNLRYRCTCACAHVAPVVLSKFALALRIINRWPIATTKLYIAWRYCDNHDQGAPGLQHEGPRALQMAVPGVRPHAATDADAHAHAGAARRPPPQGQGQQTNSNRAELPTTTNFR